MTTIGSSSTTAEGNSAIADSRAESVWAPPSSLVQHYYRAPPDRGEKEALSRALRESGGNRAATARRLGMSRTTLWKKLKQYGLADAAE